MGQKANGNNFLSANGNAAAKPPMMMNNQRINMQS